jgi:phosphohistidine phosphatase SixA
MVRAILCVLLAAFISPALGDAALVRQLREGGYVLYMRHASTDFSQNDAKMTSYEDCASQRNLTDKGRAEARSVAPHVVRLRIPVDTVLASPFCRTMETARLAFGKALATNEVRGGPARSDDPARYAPLRKLLSSPVKSANLVIVSHGNPFHAVAGPPYLAEGEIAVVRPEVGPTGNGFKVVGRIRIEDWPLLD